MNIDVFAIAFNEAEMLPHFMAHYRKFARNITILDNESTDGTPGIAVRLGASVRSWSSDGVQDNRVMLDQKCNCWRGCDADYVVVVDIDEFVDCDPLPDFGAREVAFQCLGYQMIGVDNQPLEDITKFTLAAQYDKTAVFSPRIRSIGYGMGCHVASPSCPVVTDPRLILRHYMMLGEEYLLRRYRKYSVRMSESDIHNRWGWQYREPDDQIRAVYREALAQATEEPFRHVGKEWR